MATQPEQGVFRPIDDPIYEVSAQPAPVDKDTRFRHSSTIDATICGIGAKTANGCLNSASSTQATTFDFNNSSVSKFRWGTMGLAIDMYITALANPEATAPTTAGAANTKTHLNGVGHNAPSWNLTGALIRGITLTLGGEIIYNVSGTYLEEFTARLLRRYSYEALNERSDMLFTPVGSRSYMARQGRDAGVVASGAANITGGSLMDAELPHLSVPYIDFTVPNPFDAAATFVSFQPDTNRFANDPLLLERANRWMSGSSTHLRRITKIIPFNDLFPAFPDCVMRNLRKIKIEIQWAQTQDLLEHTSSNVATHAGVFVTRSYIVTDAYQMTAGQEESTTAEKVQGASDILPVLMTRSYPFPYTPGAGYIIPAIKSFDSIMIMQTARGHSNGQAVAESNVAYQSFGEFLLFNNSAGGVRTIKLHADDPEAPAPIDNVMIQWNGQSYPMSPLQVGDANAVNPTRLYQEYLKACARVGRRDTSAAIPFEIFKATMPFICFRPFADDAPKLTAEGHDINIVMNGGVSPAAASETANVVAVVFYYKCFRITPDGRCSEVA